MAEVYRTLITSGKARGGKNSPLSVSDNLQRLTQPRRKVSGVPRHRFHRDLSGPSTPHFTPSHPSSSYRLLAHPMSATTFHLVPLHQVQSCLTWSHRVPIIISIPLDPSIQSSRPQSLVSRGLSVRYPVSNIGSGCLLFVMVSSLALSVWEAARTNQLSQSDRLERILFIASVDRYHGRRP